MSIKEHGTNMNENKRIRCSRNERDTISFQGYPAVSLPREEKCAKLDKIGHEMGLGARLWAYTQSGRRSKLQESF